MDLAALPLQLVWRREPSWRALPTVEIEADSPQGVVRWACTQARAAGVLPGHRYGPALARCPTLRARVVPAEELAQELEALLRALRGLSPRVEPSVTGCFWLDGEGLERWLLHEAAHRPTHAPEARATPATSPAALWAAAIRRHVHARGLDARIVIGYNRFASFALARAARTPITIYPTAEAEHAAAKIVPLALLALAPRLRDELARLGVTTVGQLVRLPAGGILERFGHDAHHLYQLAAADGWDPLRPAVPREPFIEHQLLDDEVHGLEPLLFVIKAMLHRLLPRLAARGQALTGLRLTLTLRDAVRQTRPREELLRPAEPTLDARALVRLIHLRLENMPLDAGVVALALEAEHAAASRAQLALFVQKPRRDLAAVHAALAHVRAELGDDAIAIAEAKDGHLPEARYGWRIGGELRLPTAATLHAHPGSLALSLVRRVYWRPQRLALPTRHGGHGDDRPDPRAGPRHEARPDRLPGEVARLSGPFVVSGGWWAQALHREYHFAEYAQGDCLWVFFDRTRNTWYLHGRLE